MFDKLVGTHVKVVYQRSDDDRPFVVDGKLLEEKDGFISLEKNGEVHYISLQKIIRVSPFKSEGPLSQNFNQKIKTHGSG